MTTTQQVINKLKEHSIEMWALASGEPKDSPSKFTTNMNRVAFALKPSAEGKILLQVKELRTAMFYSIKLTATQQKVVDKMYNNVVKYNVQKFEDSLEETLKMAVTESNQMKLPL